MAAPAPSRFPEINAAEMTVALNERVKGQRHVTEDLAHLVRRQGNNSIRQRPVASLLFAGSRDTGKTELARALAAYLFQSEKVLLQIDCSDRDPQAMARLTSLVIRNPRRVIQFHSLEMAGPELLALCAQVIHYGQVLDPASGDLADFKNSIVILESREETAALLKFQEQFAGSDDLTQVATRHLSSIGKLDPEIAQYLDRVYVFKPLDLVSLAELAAQRMQSRATEFELELVFVDPHVIARATTAIANFGIRTLDYMIHTMTDSYFQAARDAGAVRVRLDVEDDGVMAITEVD